MDTNDAYLMTGFITGSIFLQPVNNNSQQKKKVHVQIFIKLKKQGLEHLKCWFWIITIFMTPYDMTHPIICTWMIVQMANTQQYYSLGQSVLDHCTRGEKKKKKKNGIEVLFLWQRSRSRELFREYSLTSVDWWLYYECWETDKKKMSTRLSCISSYYTWWIIRYRVQMRIPAGSQIFIKPSPWTEKYTLSQWLYFCVFMPTLNASIGLVIIADTRFQ